MEIFDELPDLTEPFLFAPWAGRLPGGNPDLISLLPVGSINAAYESPEVSGSGSEWAVACILLADPFLRASDLVRSLGSRGFRRVANFPTVQVIDGEAGRALDMAEMGGAREIAALEFLLRAGFDVVPFACSLAVARGIARIGAQRIVLHPGVPVLDWRHRASAAIGLVQTAQALRRENPGLEILVYDCPGYGAELRPALESGDGIVRWRRRTGQLNRS
ncbi:MAG TPA: phosphoenolpyruvate hydrolase family protein [Microvirga sp.]|nr:phosphoenolpyruvate hydrolase family protein [Microvirga sp.]